MPEAKEIAIIMGSKSDLPNLKGCFQILDDFKVPFTARVMSAHRTPDEALAFASQAEEKGFKVIICAAGMAAHLAGVIAAHTTLPVIGIPMSCPPFNGIDSLFSTVQMPPGIPVATVTAGSAGAKNAALFALSILALSNPQIASALQAFRAEQTEKVRQADRDLQNELK